MLKNNHGLRDSLIMACCVGALGAFGAFFRWLQMQIARDPDTGLMDPSVLNYIVPLIIIIAAAALLWLVRSLDEYRLSRTEAEEYLAAHKDETEAPDFGKCEYPTGLYEAMRFTSLAYIILAWLIAVIMMVGGVLTLADSALDAQRGFYVVISALAVLSGLSFPLVCNAARKRYSPSLVSIFMALPVIMYCLWLIVCYRANSNNPTSGSTRRGHRRVRRHSRAARLGGLRLRQGRPEARVLSRVFRRVHVHNDPVRQPLYGAGAHHSRHRGDAAA